MVTKTVQVKDLAQMIRVLADENRLQIIACLSSGEKCVCQLTDVVDIPQNLMSHHLKVLKANGFVIDEQRGRWVYYTLKPNIIKDILAKIELFCQSNICDANNVC